MARGRPSKTTHADRLLIRELWKQGRSDTKRFTAKEIADKFSISAMSVYRAIALDDVEMEERRRDEISSVGA